MNPVAPLGCLYLSIQIESMFIYGGDSWIRANDLLRMKELHFHCAMSPLAGGTRIELVIPESKSGVLPLH